MQNFKHTFLALLLVFGTKTTFGTDTTSQKEQEEIAQKYNTQVAADLCPFTGNIPENEHMPPIFEIHGTVFEMDPVNGKVYLMHNTRYNQPALEIAYEIFDGTHELVQSTKNIPEEEIQRVKTELVNSLIYQWTEEKGNKCKISYEEEEKLENKICEFINKEITTSDVIALCAIDNIYKPATLTLLFPELSEQLKEITLHKKTYEKHEENEHGTYYFYYSSYTNISQEIIEQKAKKYAEMFKNLPEEKQKFQVLTFWLAQEVI